MLRTRSNGPGPLTPTQVLWERMNALVRRANLRRLAVSLGVTAALTLVLFGLVLGAGLVSGKSMQPSFQDKDIVLFSRLGKCGRHDVVIVRTDSGLIRKYVKRVIGMPGDTVDIGENGVTINGEALDVPCAVGATRDTGALRYPMKLGEGEYFVLGDNRENSKDSRVLGAVKEDQIEGRVIAVLRTNR